MKISTREGLIKTAMEDDEVAFGEILSRGGNADDFLNMKKKYGLEDGTLNDVNIELELKASVGLKKTARLNLQQVEQYPEDTTPVSMGQKPIVKKIISFIKKTYNTATDIIKSSGGLGKWLRNYFDESIPNDVIERAANLFVSQMRQTAKYKNKIARLAAKAKDPDAQLRKMVEVSYYKFGNGVQVDIMDISKIFNEGVAAIKSGQNIDDVMPEIIKKYRKN